MLSLACFLMNIIMHARVLVLSRGRGTRFLTCGDKIYRCQPVKFGFCLVNINVTYCLSFQKGYLLNCYIIRSLIFIEIKIGIEL